MLTPLRETLGRPGGPAVFASLQHRNYRLLWLGLLGSLTGYWIQTVALGWLVLEMTDSRFWLGIVNAAGTIPLLIFSLLGGVLADRIDRRQLLIVTRIVLTALATLLAVLTSRGQVQVWHIVAISVVTGIVWSMDMPARQALVPALVGPGQLTNAVALLSAGFNITRIIGPALSGALLPFIGVGGCLYLTGVGYALLIVALVAMRVPPIVHHNASATMWQNFKEWVDYTRNNPAVFTLILLVAVPTIFGMPYTAMMPSFARDVLTVGETGLGLLLTATGIGALLGALTIAGLGDFEGRRRLILAGCFLFGVGLMAFSLSQWFALSFVMLVIVGGVAASYMTSANSLIQHIVPDAFRGRVLSIYMLTWGLMPLGSLGIGAAADQWGVGPAVGAGGLICALFALTVWVQQARKHLFE